MALEGILFQLVGLIVVIPFIAFILKLVVKRFGVSDYSYLTALKAVFIIQVVNFVFSVIAQLFLPTIFVWWKFINFTFIQFGFTLYILKRTYALSWVKTLLLWLCWGFVTVLITFAIFGLIGFILSSMDVDLMPFI